MEEQRDKDFRYVGTSVPRREDLRLLTGRSMFVADMTRDRMLHAVFVRSQHAHGELVQVDVSEALKIPGVVAAYAGRELVGAIGPLPAVQISAPSPWQKEVPHRVQTPPQNVFATDRVRYVGEPVAVVLAEDRQSAEDGADHVRVDVTPLPPVTDFRQALAEDAPVIHPQVGSNLLGHFLVEKGDYEKAFAEAPHRLKREIKHHRYSGTPMECRGVLAEYDERADFLTIWSSTQLVHHVRHFLADALGLPEARIRCVAPDVGGGFGVKGLVYPEEVVVGYLARALRRPVKWIEDRKEHLLSSIHSRDQVHEAEIAFDDDGRILALRDTFYVDIGAFSPIGVVASYNTAAHLMGPYKIPACRVEGHVVATNKMFNAPYRGAGRPEAVQTMERLMDLIAQHLGLEPDEVRRRNMVRPEDMPYDVGILYRDGSRVVYDSGDYIQALDKTVAALGGMPEFRRRQREARKQDRYLGIGFGCYVEGTGVGPFEGATVRIDPSGMIYVATGACPHGQGHETVYAQITADLWRVTPDQVIVRAGDTAAIPYGVGTIASRSAVNVSGAIHEATHRLQEKIRRLAATILECSPDDLTFEDGSVVIRGAPQRRLTLKELAAAARPGWDHRRPEGLDADLEVTYYFEPPTVTWSYAVHGAIVEVDIATGQVTIDRYVVAHDAGTIINPLLADGQVLGGVVQGLGGALYEEFLYDENGQLLTGSFMDYLLPSTTEVPHIELIHQEIPSPRNPLGIKGLGEGGAIAPPVVIANAVSDALRPFGVEWNHTPVRPDRVLEQIRFRKGESAAL